ncbi:MAG: hypothetical protein IT330_18635 [Anaerolineae bacterium]|nr:hypothetical protein [Anaerolineae bacterium]
MNPPANKPIPADTVAFIDAVIMNLVEQQELLALRLHREDLSDNPMAQLFSAYGRNAATLGDLLRDRLALTQSPQNEFQTVMNQALDELGKEWGLEL